MMRYVVSESGSVTVAVARPLASVAATPARTPPAGSPCASRLLRGQAAGPGGWLQRRRHRPRRRLPARRCDDHAAAAATSHPVRAPAGPAPPGRSCTDARGIRALSGCPRSAPAAASARVDRAQHIRRRVAGEREQSVVHRPQRDLARRAAAFARRRRQPRRSPAAPAGTPSRSEDTSTRSRFDGSSTVSSV